MTQLTIDTSGLDALRVAIPGMNRALCEATAEQLRDQMRKALNDFLWAVKAQSAPMQQPEWRCLRLSFDEIVETAWTCRDLQTAET